MELVTALKEGAAVPSLWEEIEMALRPNLGDGDEAETSTPRAQRGRVTSQSWIRSVGTSRSSISRLSRANLEAMASLRQPLAFEMLKEFFGYLEEVYGGIRRDRMSHIRDFQREKGDTLRIMYARLAWFAREIGNAFTERQLVALYMSK